MRGLVLLELRGPVEAFPAGLAHVRVLLSVAGDDVPLEVTGIGAAVVAVWALVRNRCSWCRRRRRRTSTGLLRGVRLGHVATQLILLRKRLAAVLTSAEGTGNT